MKGIINLAGFIAAANCQTVTLGPISNYEQPPAATVTASGDHLEIFPEDFSNGIPPEGINVAFGPDLQAAITSTLDGVCANGFSQECSDELSKVLDTQHTYTVASRVVGIDDLLLVAGVAALGVLIQAIILEHRKSDQGGQPISAINIPATDIAQVQSQTASSVVIATDTSTVTITPAPSASISAATITTLTADANGHQSGDIVIALPTAAAQIMNELIYKSDVSNECINIQLRKRQASGGGDFAAVNDVADFIMPFVPPDQLLNALGVEVGQHLPRVVDTAQQASLAAAQAFAAGLPEFAGLATEFTDVLAEVAWLGVLSWCADQVNDLSELVLKNGDYEAGDDGGGDDDNGECPADAPTGKDAPLCKDSSCESKEGTCSTGEYKGCKCLTQVTPHWTGGDQELWSGFQFVLQGLLSDQGWGCDQENRITLDTKDFDGLVEAFCRDVDLTTSIEKTISPSDAGFSGYEDYIFKFSWTKKDDETCVTSCTDIYQAFTSNNICSYDSHTKVTNGYQDFTCGTAVFNITEKGDDETGSGDGDGVYTNQGNLYCGTETDQGNPNHFTTRETMGKAAEWFCETLTVAGLRWTPGEVAEADAFVDYHYNSYTGDPMYLTAKWIDNSGCPVTDFSGSNAESMNSTCRSYFGTITDECDTAQNGKHWCKQGGTFFRDCVEWGVKRDTFQGDWVPAEDAGDDWRPGWTLCGGDGDCGDYADGECGALGYGAYCVLGGDSYCACRLN
ncbi:hypothetical protein M409DRAFT_24256 [Zasmidium cellare ATCC 36951]|uniref:Carbohydrate-binding module family 18 protein n=1 Tax=Zasmidium cellare ATCC 36951 TaxID=1080233 RepID=A0A6A6CJ09_ZASCE|nr:uncharacterized protein M409DRAFT_24256 [Zasmidium cellare ATCC 36951]KAF2165406.1 hypothetical protein M409DRAFT_24256 [Zasmidium cellare ATCC 36951]